uniref:Uncharacterized protein n=1 Tax=Cacopsylla melanoneura TaxID=428564 RepID=A0A8D9ETS4_9HEMI
MLSVVRCCQSGLLLVRLNVRYERDLASFDLLTRICSLSVVLVGLPVHHYSVQNWNMSSVSQRRFVFSCPQLFVVAGPVRELLDLIANSQSVYFLTRVLVEAA